MNSRQSELEDGRPSGLSSCGSSQQAVSPVPASIPDAIPLRRVASQIRHRLSDMEFRCNVRSFGGDPKAKTGGYVISEVADWQLRQWLAIIEHQAQAIEARRAETGTGSVHESAVA